jgi:hypothetical protein
LPRIVFFKTKKLIITSNDWDQDAAAADILFAKYGREHRV